MIAITDNIIPHEKHFYDKPCTNYFLGSIDKAVAMSKKVLNDLQTIFPNKTVAKHSSYHAHPLYDNFGEKLDRTEACKQLNLDPQKQFLLFFGFIRKYKGLDLLLESMHLLPESCKNIELIVAGEFYEDSEPYLDIIRAHKLENRVHLHTKFISNDEVKVYFSAADVVAQPYRSATQSGVSQVAYHFENPMIITNVGGLSELVPHQKAGLVCEPNPEGISGAIVEIFEGQNIPQMKENLQELKKQFSWESMVNELSGDL
jgi:glycosyltransferase involved in cell wall biosynthesis